MDTIKEAATEFLAAKRVAVTGVSRDAKGHGSNVVYQRLRQRGYEVFAVNPNAETVEGDTAYPDLKSIPGRHPQHVRSSAAAGELTVAIGGTSVAVRGTGGSRCVDAPALRREVRPQHDAQEPGAVLGVRIAAVQLTESQPRLCDNP